MEVAPLFLWSTMSTSNFAFLRSGSNFTVVFLSSDLYVTRFPRNNTLCEDKRFFYYLSSAKPNPSTHLFLHQLIRGALSISCFSGVWTMKSATNVSAASKSLPTYLKVKPRSLSAGKITHKFNPPTSTELKRLCDFQAPISPTGAVKRFLKSKITHKFNHPTSPELKRFCDFQAPISPTRAVKRFLKSLSKNALKLASNLSLRSRAAAAAPSLSPPPKSFCEARQRMVEELCEVFRYLDADGDGKITWVDLHSALNSVGEEVGEKELREMIKQLDSEADGCIDVDGFIRLHCEERGEEEAERELAAAFRMFQGTSTGITPAGLQRMMCRLGVENSLTLDHCTFIISQVDLDGDGVVSFTEFKHMMTGVVH